MQSFKNPQFLVWRESNRDFIPKRLKHIPVVGLLAFSALSVAYVAFSDGVQRLCSPQVLRPALSIGVLFGLCVYVLFGKCGLAFLKSLLWLTAGGWLLNIVFWSRHTVIEVIAQVAGWIAIFAWVWALEVPELREESPKDVPGPRET